ncbi:MAG TPA: hypothetical protein VGT99_08515 [Gammaproteobacteria bacterium]|nr:hypothetical protein [Gammaproteobacteria bacterium]
MRVKASTDQTVEILTQILKVQAIQATKDMSITDGARLLKLVGLDNQTIADVLNTSSATVRTLTANLRAGSRRKRGGSKEK